MYLSEYGRRFLSSLSASYQTSNLSFNLKNCCSCSLVYLTQNNNQMWCIYIGFIHSPKTNSFNKKIWRCHHFLLLGECIKPLKYHCISQWQTDVSSNCISYWLVQIGCHWCWFLCTCLCLLFSFCQNFLRVGFSGQSAIVLCNVE